jgi:hypothetical protein
MKIKLTFSFVCLLALSGCASVPTIDEAEAQKFKTFDSPSPGNSGLYIYRENGIAGAALKKFIYVDGECLGETAPGVFFYHEVKGNEEHTISTESEFSENHLSLTTQPGINYFVNQYTKMGVFVGGAAVELVDESEGKSEVSKLDMAKNIDCPSI